MHPFWNKVVEIVPRWVAPNVLTFAGFLLTVLDFLLLSYYDYNYLAATSINGTTVNAPTNGHSEVVPQSLWSVLAVFLFLAYTLDGIDGKQARRTQTSGPLGELFDHGLDSYSVFFIPACLYSIVGRLDFSISPLRMYYVLWNILFNFYLSHWEKYNTGVLFLPWGYDFSMWASTFFFLWTGIKGTGYYKRYMFGSYTLANGFEWLIYATGFLTNLPVAIYNTHKSYKLRTGKMRSATEAIRPLWPLLTVFVVLNVWVHKSDTLVEYDPRMLFLLIGTVFSNVACRLIVAQMSSQRCDAVNWLLWPLLAGALGALAAPRFEPAIFYALTALTVAAHLHYGTCVVRQMCDHFRISCFYIKQRSD
ncbi:ethanolaminephosphotransferase 1-like [Hyposmocoma kahamanoa]|uniref:ethanolaminephosphotransferase 1-like n=1 Tax=Hyposmocoma kahamanoa TaxID=1477025 RepID=UPI000E6D788F|nr:ethanolaminephosphotransferase 1-like [Hyposmocoma kahamanoa]XP_026332738.1 ethanolaminephosphotransferase 1-like [Hyposmocoma kahamanoa]